MALTGLQIFKLMPKTNCKDCGHPTCLAFSMALASAKIALDACPHASDEAKEALGAAAAPPVAKVAFGAGVKTREMGDETVLFRHDKQFFHPTCIALTVSDALDDEAFDARLADINDMTFERVGEKVQIDGIALLYDSADPSVFARRASEIADKGVFAPILVCESSEAISKALEVCAGSKPLIRGATEENWEVMASLAAQSDCPLCAVAADIDRLESLAVKISAITKNIVIGTTATTPAQTLADLTQIRRQAIRRKIKGLGYPSIVSVLGKDPVEQAALASAYIAKYASLIILDNADKAGILPLCALRQNLFSDPQKPAQVEPGIYPLGEPDADSPVYCTTNFSLTYFTVEGELLSARIPSWLIAVPTDGTSVLTAWASGKFTSEKIAEFMEKIDLNSKINHRNIIIPGYVAVLKASLEEKSGWKVIVAPNEASGLPAFAKANFA